VLNERAGQYGFLVRPVNDMKEMRNKARRRHKISIRYCVLNLMIACVRISRRVGRVNSTCCLTEDYCEDDSSRTSVPFPLVDTVQGLGGVLPE